MIGERKIARDIGEPQLRTISEILTEPDRWHLVSDYPEGFGGRQYHPMQATNFTDPHPVDGRATIAKCPASMLVCVVEVPEDER